MTNITTVKAPRCFCACFGLHPAKGKRELSVVDDQYQHQYVAKIASGVLFCAVLTSDC